MNNPNPFISPGSLLEQKNRKRQQAKVAIFAIFGFTVLTIVPVLLMQGCKDKEKTGGDPLTNSAPADLKSNDMTTSTSNSTPPLNPPGTTNTNAAVATPTNTPVVELPPTNNPPPPPAMNPSEYVIQPKDSFYSIGKKFNVSMKALQAANPGLTPTKLQPGKKIVIPAPTTPTSTGTNLTTADGETLYLVKSGDTLGKIAKSHGTTVKAIRAANGLKSDAIKAGDKLKLPAKTSAPVISDPAPATNPAGSNTTPATGVIR